MKFVSMKYSLVILNITFMLSSVESLRRLPYIILQDMNKEPFLPKDGWVNPYNSMKKNELELLCNEHFTAQRIEYFSQSNISESIKPFIKKKTRGSLLLIGINEHKENDVQAHRCKYQKQEIILMKNSKYEGLLIFVNECGRKKGAILSFRGIITNHLSYEDAGRAAIGFFGISGILVDVKEQQLIRICASLFQSLSSDLVQSLASYYITQITGIIEGKINLYCEGVAPVEKQVFIRYIIILSKWDVVDITVIHEKENGEFIETNTVYLM